VIVKRPIHLAARCAAAGQVMRRDAGSLRGVRRDTNRTTSRVTGRENGLHGGVIVKQPIHLAAHRAIASQVLRWDAGSLLAARRDTKHTTLRVTYPRSG
jgi:hypothetical protein